MLVELLQSFTGFHLKYLRFGIFIQYMTANAIIEYNSDTIKLMLFYKTNEIHCIVNFKNFIFT